MEGTQSAGGFEWRGIVVRESACFERDQLEERTQNLLDGGGDESQGGSREKAGCGKSSELRQEW